RGTKLADAKVIFEGRPEDVYAGAYWDLTPGYEREFARRDPTFFTNEMFVRRNGKFMKIDIPDDAEAEVVRDWMYVTLRKDWKVKDRTYQAGSLLAIP